MAMAKALHLQVVVEGIETSQQASYFSPGEQPILGQGWLYGRPVAATEFQRLWGESVQKPPDATNPEYQ
jgi:sensor c-di-GMP phosphodiesterase-like protein